MNEPSKPRQQILLTGGAGYIGSHVAVGLIENGYDVVILDNFSNSNEISVQRVKSITESVADAKIKLYEGDIRKPADLDKVFSENNIFAVIHFAGLKAVGESVAKPLEYYDNNVVGSLRLLESMKRYGVNKLVFSSSATVYGSADSPNDETMTTGIGITNPYGQTKYVIEKILNDVAVGNPDFSGIALRYYNPVGAHSSGLIGEDPKGIPNNLIPYIAQVASGKRETLNIWGNDYDTPDGTGVRDYIHVVDLAEGHLAALKYISNDFTGFDAINLGTGKGSSVLDMLHAFERACGQALPYQIQERRPGDLAVSYANADKAKRLLGWQAKKSIDDMCADTWKWQTLNPNGYIDVS